MRARLIVYSILYVAPPAFKVPYGVGIAEGPDGKRMLVRVREEELSGLSIGAEGDVREEQFEGHNLNFFYPLKQTPDSKRI